MAKALTGRTRLHKKSNAGSADDIIASERNGLFISHANPEDNAFAIWLGSRLSELGYEVWADVMRLRGGEDWSRKVEVSLRRRARKMLFVGTAAASSKDGPRAEIQIAVEVSRTLKDDCFIIPLHLEPHDVPFLIARAQYVDFSRGWALGLKDLIQTLESYGVLRCGAPGATWRQLQCLHEKQLDRRPELLISNWAPAELPPTVRYFDFVDHISQVGIESKIRRAPFGAVPHLRGFFSFAELVDLQQHFGASLRVKVIDERSTGQFLQGLQQRAVEPWQASNIVVDLLRQALDRQLRERGLSQNEMADGRTVWWGSLGVAPTKRLRFRWGNVKGSRQILGYFSRGNARLYWHYGISPMIRTRPTPCVAMIGRLIFTEDGKRIIDSRRAHRLRRSLARSWRNDKWRDMMLALLHWLSDGEAVLDIPVGTSQAMRIKLPPMSFESPVSFIETKLTGSDDDGLTDADWDDAEALFDEAEADAGD